MKAMKFIGQNYSTEAIREDIRDIVPSVESITRSGYYWKVEKRNGKCKFVRGKRNLMLYLGWLLAHDSLIK